MSYTRSGKKKLLRFFTLKTFHLKIKLIVKDWNFIDKSVWVSPSNHDKVAPDIFMSREGKKFHHIRRKFQLIQAVEHNKTWVIVCAHFFQDNWQMQIKLITYSNNFRCIYWLFNKRIIFGRKPIIPSLEEILHLRGKSVTKLVLPIPPNTHTDFLFVWHFFFNLRHGLSFRLTFLQLSKYVWAPWFFQFSQMAISCRCAEDIRQLLLSGKKSCNMTKRPFFRDKFTGLLFISCLYPPFKLNGLRTNWPPLWWTIQLEKPWLIAICNCMFLKICWSLTN